jgi:hypothetical protein
MENLNELLEGLMRDQLINEYDLLNSDECVGVEDGKRYIYMIHDTRVYDDTRYMELCDSAEIVSEDYEDGEHETKLIIK